MVVNAEDGVEELGECESSLTEQERRYRKCNRSETVNKRRTVHLRPQVVIPTRCTYTQLQGPHQHTYQTSCIFLQYLYPEQRTHHSQKEESKHQLNSLLFYLSHLGINILYNLPNLFFLPRLHKLQNKQSNWRGL